MKAKLALFCNVEKEAVITAGRRDIYEVPLVAHQRGVDEQDNQRFSNLDGSRCWRLAGDSLPGSRSPNTR